MSKVHRIYVEKRSEFAVEALELLHNLENQLKINSIQELIAMMFKVLTISF